jgi:3-hydroxyacyl-[acyl-carrier-protein] dehydratase
MMQIDFDTVRKLLPQAYPFVLVDRVEQFEKNQSIVCLKNVSGNEWMFPGHFPEKAIYPGVLLIEGLAQSGILLFQLSQETDGSVFATGTGDLGGGKQARTFLLASVKTRFLKAVVPGDQLFYSCEVIKMTSRAGILEGVVTVNGEIAAKAELTFGVV